MHRYPIRRRRADNPFRAAVAGVPTLAVATLAATTLAVAALAVATLAVATLAVALLSIPGLASLAQAAAPAACSSSQTAVWLGDGPGGGTAGTIYYPLEFTNISHRSCTLFGYPGVSAVNGRGTQVGVAATRSSAHVAIVTLQAGATAHALLGIHDWGAICSHDTPAAGLKVYPPGLRDARVITGFPFGACAGKSVLAVNPIRGGTGVPGYTTS